jgi:hypothetical protein
LGKNKRVYYRISSSFPLGQQWFCNFLFSVFLCLATYEQVKKLLKTEPAKNLLIGFVDVVTIISPLFQKFQKLKVSAH